jgi:hypothetical protein
VSSEGFKTMVLPVASAGATLRDRENTGKCELMSCALAKPTHSGHSMG